MTYSPRPVDTSSITLSDDVLGLKELLAEHSHDIWARQRITDGWTFGPARDDAQKKHPCLIPYAELPESEKRYDRNMALETLKFILANRYHIVPPLGVAVTRIEDTDAAQAVERCEVMLAGLRAAEQRSSQGQSGSAELTELSQVWSDHVDDDSAWRCSPELYRQLGRRFLKLGAAPVAKEVAQAGLAVSVIGVDGKQKPLWGSDVELRQILGLAFARTGNPDEAQKVLLDLKADGAADEETLGVLARTYKDQALQLPAGSDRRRELMQASLAAYREAYRVSSGIWTGINVATLERLHCDPAESDRIARNVRAQCSQELEQLRAQNVAPAKTYWHLATLGEAALNLGDVTAAGDFFQQAHNAAPKSYGDLNSTRRHARWLLEHGGHDAALLNEWLPIPKVVVFAGHMMDRPGRTPERFPDRIHDAVKNSILEWLRQENALIGFSSSACGSDLIFQEALRELGGEGHVVLPYQSDLFRPDSVAIFRDKRDESWSSRYDAVLKNATQVVTVSRQRMDRGGISYDYANQVLQGLAAVKKNELETDLVGLVVWNGQPGDGQGGTASVVEHWHASNVPVYRVDLSQLPTAANATLPVIRDQRRPRTTATNISSTSDDSSVMALLFADVVGFSDMREREIPIFVREYLKRTAQLIEQYSAATPVRETWGDGLFLAFDEIREAGRFALDLVDLVKNTPWRTLELETPMSIRVALHAGPVYHATDPITGLPKRAGTHVSHAARLEPKTPPDEVYASEAFAALVAVQGITDDFTCEYVKQLKWAKSHGTFPTYVVRRPRS